MISKKKAISILLGKWKIVRNRIRKWKATPRDSNTPSEAVSKGRTNQDENAAPTQSETTLDDQSGQQSPAPQKEEKSSGRDDSLERETQTNADVAQMSGGLPAPKVATGVEGPMHTRNEKKPTRPRRLFGTVMDRITGTQVKPDAGNFA